MSGKTGLNTYVPTIKKRRIEHKRIYGETTLRVARVFLALLVTGGGLLVSYWFGSSGQASPNNDTLSAYLKLDEAFAGTAADSSGDGNPGTVTGATASSDVSATSFANSHSLSFDGNDYVSVASAPELNPADLTLSFWFKLNATSGIQTLVAKWDINAYQQYVIQSSGNTLYFYTGDGSNVTADSIAHSQTLTSGVWYHAVGTITGTTRCLSIDGAEECDTADTTLGTSSEPLTIGSKQLNDGAFVEYLNGYIDDVRVYSRVLGASELADLTAGGHTAATWDGTDSADYDTPGNWDTGAVPDPYTLVTIADSANHPQAATAVALAGLTIDSGARLNLAGQNLTINDGGTFSNNGTLQLRNSETLSGLTNDTDSGTILLTPDSDITGLKTGNSYHNLVFNNGTFAHWPLDEATGPAADVSGFGRTAAHQGAAAASSAVPAVQYANNHSISLDGTADYLEFDAVTLPNIATYCAWINMDAGSGTVLGQTGADRYALRINSGNQVAVSNEAGSDTAMWSISSVYGGWHHLCLSQTFSFPVYTVSLYVDGAAVGAPEELDDGVGLINAIGRGGTSYFDGRIDDVRIYSRNLNPTDIDRLADGLEPAGYTATQTLGANLDVNGDLTLASGRLDVSSSDYSINIGGDVRADGAVFVPRGGTVTLDGTDQSINSSLTFYNLTKSVTEAATLTFGKDSTTTVTNMLTLNGASGERLSLRSSTPGTEWFLNPTGDETIDYLDVQDSHNIDTEPVDITGIDFNDSGNNTNWTVNVAPGVPTSLGPTQYINGSYGTDDTPTLTFSLSDANPVDLLRFHVQIDNNSDFSSPEVDYISDLGAHGSRSFTVGQNGSDDTYVVGTDDMTMVSGNYYWRVRAIDDYDTPNASAYATANGGSVAFRLDITGPTTPGTPTTVTPGTNRRPVWNWTASNDAGVGLNNPAYDLQWSTDPAFGSFSAATTNNLTYTHGTNLADGQWYFRVRGKDSLGNVSAWATSAAHVIDNTGPTTPVAPFTSSPTGIPNPTWSWSAPTDAGVGLDPTNPYILNWSLTSNFSSGVSSTTHNNNIFTHSTNLADGTWYMRVKAVDALGNESAWSSNGSVLIDGTAPSLPGMPTTTDPTNDSTPTWNWDASIDGGSGLAASPYTVQWSSEPDFSPLGGSTSASSNTYTHGTDLADGTWYIRVSARDVLSNQSGWSATGEVTIDTVAPDVPNAPATTTPTNDSTPTWAWNIPDDNAGGVGLSATPYEIRWSQDEDFNTVEDSEALATNGFTHTDQLAEGTWYFQVRATDAANNTSAWSDSGEVYIDVTAPTVPGDPSSADPVADTTPTWTWADSTDSGIGLAATPYIVEWSLDNTFTSGVFSSTAAAASFTHSTPLSDNTWYFRVRAVDAVTNQSAWSNLGSKVVDANPPTVPGTPSTTTPTADNTPAWTWTASTDTGTGLDDAEPYLIEWSTTSDFTANTFADSVATNGFTHTGPLADGTWYFRVRAQDEVGNISGYSANGTVFVDAADPSVPGQPSTTTPTTDSTPTWSWSASSDGAGVGLANPAYTVEWSDTSDFSGSVESGTSNTSSFTHSADLADGTWYIRVRATDAVGNESAWSSTGSVEIDDTAPSVPGTPGTATPTDDTTPSWTWSASTDNGVGLADPEYEMQWSLTSDFSSGNHTDTSSTNGFTHSTPLADGTWYFRVRAFDLLGNISSWSPAGTVLVSTSGPTTPGTPTTSTPTTDTTPTWGWADSTSPAGLANPAYQVEWSQDSDFDTGVSSDPINDNEFTHSTPLADGTWYFRVIAEDNTGLFSPYSAAGSVLIDTTSPSVPGTPSTTTPSADTTPAWTWSASSDGGSGLAATPYTIEWSQDNGFGSGVSSTTSATAGFTHGDQLADGTWYIRVKAEDVVGNESAWSSTASVFVDATNPTTPGTPTTTTPTADTTPTWSWTASSDSGIGLDNPAYELQWSQSATFSSGVHDDTTNNTNFTHSTPLADGTWYFRVRAVDDVGNRSNYSSNGTVVIDASAPTVPGIPTVGGPATNDTTPTWTWSASTDSGVGLGSPAYQVQWSQDNSFMSGVSSDTAAGASFTHGSGLSAGTWYFRVRAVDAVNNQSGYSGNGTVVIDTDTPSAPGTPSTTDPTTDTTPTWTWSASSDSSTALADYELQWSEDNTFNAGVNSGTAADETFTHSTALADGTWYFRVRAVDAASNSSAWSSAGSVRVDSTAPTSPANLSTDTPTKDSTPTWTWDASTDAGQAIGLGLANPAYEIAWSAASDFSSNVQSTTTNDPTFTHTDPLDFGVWYFRVRAVDQLSNKTAWVVGSVSIDNTPPVIGGASANIGVTTATISWTTDEPATTQLRYGVADQYSEVTAEADTSPRVTSHSVQLTNLPACTTIKYKIVSVDTMENEAVSDGAVLTTRGCSGNAAVMQQTTAFISKDSGGALALGGGTAALGLTVPAGFSGSNADFQIKQLSPAAALSGINQPSGRTLIGSHVYDLKSLASPHTVISSFPSALTVGINYVAADVSGYNQATLAIYRHDGTSWQPLTGCKVNTGARTVTCTTTHFSVFGLFGERAVAEPAPPLPEGDGIIEPDPEPTPKQEQGGQTEAVSDKRGIGKAVSTVITSIKRRPVWWASGVVLLAAGAGLFILYKRRSGREKHVPYGIHRDE